MARVNRLRRTIGVTALVLLGAAYSAFILEGPIDAGAAPADEEEVVRMLEAPPRPEPAVVPAIEDEAAVLMGAAGRAWAYWDAFARPRTGLVASVAWYDFATVWDMGSTVAALHSAHALGLLEEEAYVERMRALLERIGSLEVVDGAALNKFYKTDTGELADRAGEPSHTGFGWSAVDLGRLLVWLRIVADEDPAFAELARRAVDRLDLASLTKDGLIWGGAVSGNRWIRFDEGRLGYQQYAARGYELWGFPAPRAAEPGRHTRAVEVLDVPLLTDRRARSCLTSEPFLLWGLELGMPEWADSLASRLIDAQEARYQRSGRLTLLSEDAITVQPDYFYYSCVHDGDESFVVLTPEYQPAPAAPRTVSTKAAFGWYALRPSAYTVMALGEVMGRAIDGDQWVAGVTETSLRPIGAPNINTTAVILESALFARDGMPLLERVWAAADETVPEAGEDGEAPVAGGGTGEADAEPPSDVPTPADSASSGA